MRTVPLESELSLGTVSVDDGIRISQFTTDVEVTNVASGSICRCRIPPSR